MNVVNDNPVVRLGVGTLVSALLGYGGAIFVRSARRILKEGEYRHPARGLLTGRDARAVAILHLFIGLLGFVAAVGCLVGTVFFGPK